ncbi:MAG: glucose sorbosone dehydrogenase [Chromatiales bacterium]|jgi:glucose/arabinose dehydrogenase|nr:MAG: glucose sorbosone dehydrogenase [Chromatiales bacterium]
MKGRNALLALYVTLLTGCGGGGSSGMVTGPPPPASTPTITTQRVFGNLSFIQPVALLQAPGDSTRWFVAEKGGFIRVFANDQGTLSASTFLDISGLANSAGEGGLLGLAFHPNFPSTPEVFVSYTRSGTPLVSYVSRFRSIDNGLTLNAATEEVVLTVNQPATNHNGGDLAFGADNFLYMGFGDGGGANDQYGNGQNTNTLMGTIVRVDVAGGLPYAIPAGNPYEANVMCAGGAGMTPCPEIYAWGLRNPWRFSFDGSSGKLWVGDVGQGSWEEIDVITAGGNYGWNVREGAHCFNPTSGCATNFIEPISEYNHGLGSSITGGYVYRGSAIADLGGWYLFGDFGSGRLFGVPENSSPGTAPVIFDETSLQIVSFGQSTDRELYVVHFGGTIHQIVDAP